MRVLGIAFLMMLVTMASCGGGDSGVTVDGGADAAIGSQDSASDPGPGGDAGDVAGARPDAAGDEGEAIVADVEDPDAPDAGAPAEADLGPTSGDEDATANDEDAMTGGDEAGTMTVEDAMMGDDSGSMMGGDNGMMGGDNGGSMGGDGMVDAAIGPDAGQDSAVAETAAGIAIGAPCLAVDTCVAGGSGTPQCLVDWPGGYCAVVDCAQHGHDCPGDPGLGGAATTGSKCVLAPTARCLALCAGDSDCRDGYACADKSDAAGHGLSKVCFPK